MKLLRAAYTRALQTLSLNSRQWANPFPTQAFLLLVSLTTYFRPTITNCVFSLFVFLITELSPDQVVEKFTRTLSQVTAPFLRALCGRSETAGTIRVAPVFASDPVVIPTDCPAVPVTVTPVSVPAATTHIAPTVSSDASASDNSKLLPLDTVTTPTSPVAGVSSAASPVPLNNWLTPVLRLKGMSDEHIIEEVCHLVIGSLEYTEEGLASMSDDNFDKVFSHHFTVPGRLATLRCAQRYIRRAYNEFEDGMRGLTVHTNTTAAPRLSTVGLDSEGERQAPTAVVTSNKQDASSSSVPHVANAARNSKKTAASTVSSTAAAAAVASLHAPGPASAALSVACTSPARKRHVCPLDCKCSCEAAVVLAGRKHSRDITPVRGTSGPQPPSPLTNTSSPRSVKRRSISPSRRAVILPEPGGNYTGAVLAILMEKRANHTVLKNS